MPKNCNSVTAHISTLSYMTNKSPVFLDPLIIGTPADIYPNPQVDNVVQTKYKEAMYFVMLSNF
jgi:hypothetical protein